MFILNKRERNWWKIRVSVIPMQQAQCLVSLNQIQNENEVTSDGWKIMILEDIEETKEDWHFMTIGNLSGTGKRILRSGQELRTFVCIHILVVMEMRSLSLCYYFMMGYTSGKGSDSRLF